MLNLSGMIADSGLGVQRFRSRIPLVNASRARLHSTGSSLPWATACLLAIALAVVLLGDPRFFRNEPPPVGSAPLVTAGGKIARRPTVGARNSDLVWSVQVQNV